MTNDLFADEAARVIDRVADDLLWEASVSRPPIDAFAVADRLSLRVVRDDRMQQRGRFVHQQESGPGTVVVGPDARPERRQWAVAHEIGEAFAHRVFDSLEIDPADTQPCAREHIANAIAGRLIAPSRWLTGIYRASDYDLVATKREFSTASFELLARRLVESASWPIVASVFDHNQLTWRRHSHSGRSAPLCRPERLAQRRTHRSGRPTAIIDDNAVRCWPVHEPGWKREIVLHEAIEYPADAWASADSSSNTVHRNAG